MRIKKLMLCVQNMEKKGVYMLIDMRVISSKCYSRRRNQYYALICNQLTNYESPVFCKNFNDGKQFLINGDSII